MSIIGNALAGGIADGMRVVGQQMVARDQMEGAKEQLAMKLKAERDDLLLRLAAAAKEGKLNRDAELEKERIKRKSNFEDRPDLYGAEGPLDRSKFETSTFERTDDSEYSDAVSRKMAPLKETKAFDEASYTKADRERTARNRKARVETDLPQHADDLEKGRSRAIANEVFARDPAGADAAAAMLTADGRDRFKMSTGGNAIIDVARGDVDTTAVGDSVIRKNDRPPAARTGGGRAGSDPAPANLRALVTSLRTQSSNISRNITKLQEGVLTPQKREDIAAAKAELAEVNRRLREAESRLAGNASQGDNAAAPAPSQRPSLNSFMRK